MFQPQPICWYPPGVGLLSHQEAEATCAHLLANAKVVEGQLKALRTEHEVLRAEANALSLRWKKLGEVGEMGSEGTGCEGT